ncbi:sensor histidine kinase [Aquimarina algiphila]|uniref:sensor histidine kinase n=1 Tax=Aquimarina algiphila TaxID=2047982 RepID=UPI002330CC0A|nr:histidine kinase [Aquimarina algiphila]
MPKTESKFFFNKNLIRFLLLFYTTAYIIDIAASLLLSFDTDNTNDWSQVFIAYIFSYVTKLMFITLAIIITKLFIFQKKSNLISVFVHIVFAFLLSFYNAIGQMVLRKYSSEDPIEITFESVYSRGLYGLSFNFFLYFSIIAIVYAFYYLKKQKEQELLQSNLQTQLLDAKIKALQSQLQPHFLFNTLNDISSLMDISVERSQDALADLSDMLRRTMEIKTKYIPLQEELEILNKYIDIEKIRYADKINFDIRVNKDVLNLAVPPLMLQPIVENAIKHGFSYHHDTLQIDIIIESIYKELVFKIINNGKPLVEDEILFRTGLGNVIERLDTLYGEDYEFSITNQNDIGVVTIIKITV